MASKISLDAARLVDQARRLADASRWSDAADAYGKALELAPDDTVIMDQLGWCLSRAKRYSEAIEVYRDLIRRQPDKAKWPYMLGYQYYDQQQWRLALQWFDRALEIWDAYLVVLYRKGYAHAKLGETDLAEQAFQKCRALWRALEDEEQERGAKYYSRASFQLGRILLERGQSRKAEQALSEAVSYGPPDAHKHYNYGKALLRNDKPHEALEQFQLADRIKPGTDYIITHVARAHIDLEQHQQAEAALERIPARQRKPYVWCEIGKLCLARGAAQQAVAPLVKATQLDPSNHNQFYALGQAYEACEQPAAAYKAYVRAVETRLREYGLDFPEAQERLVAVERQAAAGGIELESQDDASASPEGYVQTYKADRGFGFISRRAGADIFFHISDVTTPHAIEPGARVRFSVTDSPKGPRAVEVVVVE